MPPRTLAVRLRTSYDNLATTIGEYALICKRVVAYEHPELDNIHCHLLLVDVHCTNQTLKNIMREHGIALKGAGQLSFKESYMDNNTKIRTEIDTETIPKYITYMSKGKYEPKYVSGYDDAFIADCKSNWITYSTKPQSFINYKAFEAQYLKTSPSYDLKDIMAAAHAFCMAKHCSHSQLCRNEISQMIDDFCWYNKIDKKYKIPHHDLI